MTNRRKWLPGLLLFAALPAPAWAQDLCASLDRIVRTAREPAPFATLAAAEASGEILVPGFRPMSCRVAVGHGVFCWRNLAPRALEVPVMEAAVRDCLGVPPLPEGPGERPYRAPDSVFRASGLRFEIGNHCTPRCRAGLLASFRVVLERSDR